MSGVCGGLPNVPQIASSLDDLHVTVDFNLAVLGEHLGFPEVVPQRRLQGPLSRMARSVCGEHSPAEKKTNTAVVEESCALAGETAGYEIGVFAAAALAEREVALSDLCYRQ